MGRRGSSRYRAAGTTGGLDPAGAHHADVTDEQRLEDAPFTNAVAERPPVADQFIEPSRRPAGAEAGADLARRRTDPAQYHALPRSGAPTPAGGGPVRESRR